MELTQESFRNLNKAKKNISRELMGYCRKDICVVEYDGTHKYYYEPKVENRLDYRLKILLKQRKSKKIGELLQNFDKIASKQFEKTL